MLRVLFCADPLAPSKTDPHFAAQASIVRELGGQVALIDHDVLLTGEVAAAVRRVPRESGPWWYRGWMIPSPSYVELVSALTQREAPLRVSPRQYRAAHELPGWFDTFRDLTPASAWCAWEPRAVPSEKDVAALADALGPGPAVAKDFVKSRKHEWAQACYIPEISDLATATAVVARMVELQDDGLNGGIVLRRFENYPRAEEARVWWIDGAPVLTTAHPDTPAVEITPDLTAIAPSVAALGCRFITTDIALRDDGQWRVVEVGDGQVSDFPASGDATVLLEQWAHRTT
ncbi:ATP-grasp domain-containing protein [Catelliglobosispora koreensis]|uniref:ATP-grasp domain-containing protein n=1 Tax=Catelliglobosispora koreensis TaxID=129052 RepID=UPI00036AD30E|nr:ATP-grasp domain-containing protein [Catelliglobosispora koreensis]